MLEIRHLRTLVALRATGSLGGAAEELHLTASAISHQLKELENYHGLSLVNRRARPLSFTPAGLELLRLADGVLPQIERSLDALRRLASGQSGQLRLASECHSCFDWLMPILNRYRRQYSDVELDFYSGFEPDPHNTLLEGDIDILITASALPIDGVRYLPLFKYESRLALAPTHALANAERIFPSDLADQTLIAYPVDPKRLDITRFLQSKNVNPARIRATELTAMLIQLVASERGVAALPDWVIAEYEKKGWIVSRPLGDGLYCQLYAAFRQGSDEPMFMRAFLDLLQDHKMDPLR